MTMQERIRLRLQELGKSAHAVSLQASDGKSRELINNVLVGRSKNPRSDTMQKIADGLGVTLEWLLHGDEAKPVPKFEGKPQPNLRLADIQPPRRGDLNRDLPLQGTAAGSMAGAFQFEGGVIDYVMRPPALLHVKDAYAIYVDGYSMEPAHAHGELRFAHPHRPPNIGDTVIIVAKYTPDGPEEGFIKKLVKRTATTYVVEQFNPPAILEFNRDYVKSVHKVLTMNELFGM